MVWPSSAQGNRPYASQTRQAVCKLATPSSENAFFFPLSFQSLTHSFAGEHSTTSLQSYCSALFAKNMGGGYTPKNLPLVFNHFRTLQNSACPKLARRSSLARSCTRQAAEAGRPVGALLFSYRKWPLSLFSSFHYGTLSFTTRGGYTPPASLHFASLLSFCYSHRRRWRSGKDRHPERAQRGGSSLPFPHAHQKEAHHVSQ